MIVCGSIPPSEQIVCVCRAASLGKNSGRPDIAAQFVFGNTVIDETFGKAAAVTGIDDQVECNLFAGSRIESDLLPRDCNFHNEPLFIVALHRFAKRKRSGITLDRTP